MLIRCLTLFGSSLLIAATALGQADAPPTTYTLTAFRDCRVVANQQLTPEQVDAYLDLRQTEDKFAGLEAPIKAVEAEISHLSAELEALSALAVQENDQTITINKRYLALQESLAGRVEAIMARHATEFEALEQSATVISQKGRRFEQAVVSSLDGVTYDQVRITQGEGPAPCLQNFL